MAVGSCHLGLCHHWQRPEADTGDVHCMRKRRRGVRMNMGMSRSKCSIGGGIKGGGRILGLSKFRNPF